MRGAREALLPALLLCAGACGSLSHEEQQRFELHSENSQNFYDRGSYPQALHQANMALALEPDDLIAQLIKGFCLIKLGNAADNPILLDESIAIFEGIIATSDGSQDFRAYMGLGSACLARSFQHDREIERIRKRQDSAFLSSALRQQDEDNMAVERAARLEHLERGERALRGVLAFPLEKDNAFAMVDLVLTLNAIGDHDTESLQLAKRALEQLDESTRITQTSLQKNVKLSANSKLDLEQHVENNRDQEVLLRDLMATICYNRGDTDGFLEQCSILEQRKLMGEVQYFNRATVNEQLERYAEAADDLQQFLRLRVQHLSYEEDDMASDVFQRIEALRARQAEKLAQSQR